MKKTAIIAGGCGGIGFATAKKLGIEGCRVVLMDIAENTDAIKELDSLGIEAVFVQGGIDQAESRWNVVQKTVDIFGRIDILVNCAGVAPKERRDLLEMTEESFDRLIGINTKGTLFLTQLVARQMIAQDLVGPKKGSIVNVGSCSAVVSSTSRGEYCISKAGVAMLTTLFADRLAAEGITVNEVRPGVIATNMTSVVKEKYDRMFESGVFPISRWGMPEDVADVIAFLCSDEVRYTTGSYIDVDGGFHIQRL